MSPGLQKSMLNFLIIREYKKHFFSMLGVNSGLLHLQAELLTTFCPLKTWIG
jgi:hypothetical protein